MNMVVQEIANLGFPAVMCIVMAWYIKFLMERHDETIKSIKENHREEMEKFNTALAANTKAIELLAAKIELYWGEKHVNG